MAPKGKPGAISDRSWRQGPEKGVPLEKFSPTLREYSSRSRALGASAICMPILVRQRRARDHGEMHYTAPLNINAMTWRTCPASTELETLVVDWFRQWLHLSRISREWFMTPLPSGPCTPSRWHGRKRHIDANARANGSKFAAASGLHFGSGAQLCRKSRDRAWPGRGERSACAE